MRQLSFLLLLAGALSIAALLSSCGNDADALGVAAQCVSNDDCSADDGLECITDFKGGYCGLANCTSNVDCPENSICVTHDNQTNYCFRICDTKSDCNANRTSDIEANCSSNILRVEAGTDKACVPPSA